MAKIDETYHKLLNEILNKGFEYEDPNRKGVKRIQIPSYTLKHDFKDGFPAITTKKLYWEGVVGELLWFLRGDTNIKYLVDNNINIWNKDAYNYYCKTLGKGCSYDEYIRMIKEKNNNLGDLGRVYGAQWRDWKSNIYDFNGSIINKPLDQISNLIKGLKENPMGTRHIVTAWNPAELDDMALPPCHWSFEILVEPLNLKQRYNLHTNDSYYKYMMIRDYSSEKCNKELDELGISKYQFTLKWHQRSVDTFLGLPFNIASYALLAHIIGKMTNMVPKGIIGDLSNVHVYEPHLNAVKEQLFRNINEYNTSELTFSKSSLNCFNDIYKESNITSLMIDNCFDMLDIGEFELKNYKSYPRIPAEMIAYSN